MPTSACCICSGRSRSSEALVGPAGYTPEGKLWALNEGGAPFQFALDEAGLYQPAVDYQTLMLAFCVHCFDRGRCSAQPGL